MSTFVWLDYAWFTGGSTLPFQRTSHKFGYGSGVKVLV
jgi:hypothetical protein